MVLTNAIRTGMLFIAWLAVAMPASAEPSESGGSLLNALLFPLALLAIFYFFLIRPQQKKQKEQTAMLGKLLVGDEVVTVAGIYGIIEEIDGSVLRLRIAKTITIQLQKHTVVSPLPKGTITLT